MAVKKDNTRIMVTLSNEQLKKLEEIKKITGKSYSKIVALLILDGMQEV